VTRLKNLEISDSYRTNKSAPFTEMRIAVPLWKKKRTVLDQERDGHNEL
jgi:hypothetical protein